MYICSLCILSIVSHRAVIWDGKKPREATYRFELHSINSDSVMIPFTKFEKVYTP